MGIRALLGTFAAAALAFGAVGAQATDREAAHGFHLAAAPQNSGPAEKPAPTAKEQPSPAEVMQRRYPHSAKVADLIGLPVLDWNDSTIGYVEKIVRTPAGNVELLVAYSARFGWIRSSYSPVSKRLVAVPIEKVAILARQIAALEMSREDFESAPTWNSSLGNPIPPDEQIKIALTRR